MNKEYLYKGLKVAPTEPCDFEINYIAFDADGVLFGYEEEPTLSEYCFRGVKNFVPMAVVFDGDWKESMVKV